MALAFDKMRMTPTNFVIQVGQDMDVRMATQNAINANANVLQAWLPMLHMFPWLEDPSSEHLTLYLECWLVAISVESHTSRIKW